MNDVVKIVTYVTDIRNLPEAGKCRAEAVVPALRARHPHRNGLFHSLLCRDNPANADPANAPE